MTSPANPMYQHMQKYRKRWYRAKKAVESPNQTDATPDKAHLNFHVVTEQWVFALKPIDTVHDAAQDIWHEVEFGPYIGLTDAHDNGLRGRMDGFELENPLSVNILTEIGKAAEHMTVHGYDLPKQPPIVEPWQPTGLSDGLKERLENARQIVPDDV